MGIEYERLDEDARKVRPINILHNGKIIGQIRFKFLPTLYDSKGRVLCIYRNQKKKSMCNCVNCQAKPKSMGKLKGRFKPDKSTFKFFCSPMHDRVRGMEWACKVYLHQDYKKWATPAGQMDKKKERLGELQVILITYLFQLIYF